MASLPKDREHNNRDDCQIHVDKEGESCVIKIESVGQEKILKELSAVINSLKNEVDQILVGHKKQQQSKELVNAIQDVTVKFKPLEDQLQKLNKNMGDNHVQLNKLSTDANKKLDEIKQDFIHLKEQQKAVGSSKETIDKLSQRVDGLDKVLKDSHEETRKQISSDLQSLKQQTPRKDEWKPVLDAVQALQVSFEKEKSKPDILARKLDAIDQKLKDSQPEHVTLMKTLQAKVDSLHKITPQTNETLAKMSDRIQVLHADVVKSHPDVVNKLNDIDHRMQEQQSCTVECVKQIVHEKLNSFIEQQTKRDGEDKLGLPKLNDRVNDGDIGKRLNDIQTRLCSADDSQRKQADCLESLSKHQAPLLDEVKRLMPMLEKLKQQKQKDFDVLNREIDQSFQSVTGKLNDLSKQQDLLKNIDCKLNVLSQNIDKDMHLRPQSDTQHDIGKEVSLRTQPLQHSLDHLLQQQRPLMDTVHELPKKLDDILHRQLQPKAIEDISAKIDPLFQSLKAIREGFEQQNQHRDRDNQILMNIENKLNQSLNDSPGRSAVNADFEKALHPLVQTVQTLKNSIDCTQRGQQKESQKIDNIEQRLSESLSATQKTADMINPTMGRLNEMLASLKQRHTTDPTITKIAEHVEHLSKLVEKNRSSDELLLQVETSIQKLKVPLETALKELHAKVEPLQHASYQSSDIKRQNDDIMQKLDTFIDPLRNVDDRIRCISQKIDQIQQKSSEESSKATVRKPADQSHEQQQTHRLLTDLNDHLNQLNNNLPMLNTLQATLDKMEKDDRSKNASQALDDRLRTLDDAMQRWNQQMLSKLKASDSDDGKTDSKDVPSVAPSDGQIANLFTNLLILQNSIQCSDKFFCQHIPQYFKRIEQSTLVQSDRDLQELLKCVKDQCLANNSSTSNPKTENSAVNTNVAFRSSPLHTDINNNPVESHSHRGLSTKSRYIGFISQQSIRDNWPNLLQQARPLIELITSQPFEFDSGINLDSLIKQNGLEQFASLTRNAVKRTDKDYDRLCYMMDSIVFDEMTLIGCREALIRPWNPSLLNRASSKGFYPYPSSDSRQVQRFTVNKDISLWMVETDDAKPYYPTEFTPNIARLNAKYDRIQQPQFCDIRQKRREDETRWNERYAFTKDNRTILFVNDLRSYFMDYDTKRKYQVHDGVPINPVCRTGVAGRGDLPFWGPNHCVVTVLLRNAHEPEVVLMRHHGNALVLPKGFYGHEARFDGQVKIVQDPVSGQILPPNLLDYWWSSFVKLNETNHSTGHLKRILNDKELREEFAEVFSQKGCNKSVFDNGYVDHPLNTDHAWVEASVWKIQFKHWRVPEMDSVKYAIASDDFKTCSTFPFVWMKLVDAMLVVPQFDRGILVDVLATGMPL